MNNEQEIILREKIEKREKLDTILAYILMIILLGCIVLVVVLKFTKKDEEEYISEEYVPNYISLNDISSSLNGVLLEENTTITSSVSGNSLFVSYGDYSINIPMVGNELMVTIDEDNRDIVTSIYKEIASIICVYYGNEEKYCRNTLDNMSDDGNDGIRIVNGENNSVVYVDTTRSFTVNNEIIYNDVTMVAFNETKYVLNLLDIKLYNVTIVTSDNNIVFSGSVDRLTDDTTNVSIIIRLYDVDDNIIGENKYEYNEDNILDSTGMFEVEFLLNDVLKLEDINTYSIEIVK